MEKTAFGVDLFFPAFIWVLRIELSSASCVASTPLSRFIGSENIFYNQNKILLAF